MVTASLSNARLKISRFWPRRLSPKIRLLRTFHVFPRPGLASVTTLVRETWSVLPTAKTRASASPLNAKALILTSRRSSTLRLWIKLAAMSMTAQAMNTALAETGPNASVQKRHQLRSKLRPLLPLITTRLTRKETPKIISLHDKTLFELVLPISKFILTNLKIA